MKIVYQVSSSAVTYAALAGAGGAVEESSCDVLIQGVVVGGNVVVTLLTIHDIIEAEQLRGKRGRMEPLGPSTIDPTPSQKLKERPHSKPTPAPCQQTDTTMGIYQNYAIVAIS